MAELERAFILGGGADDLALDIVLRESHTSELQVTDNPVETGVVVADHAFMRPLELEIEGLVSDTWLHAFQPNGLAVPDRFYSSKASRSAAAWDVFTGLQRAVRIVSVQTGLKLYENMVIVSLSVDQDVDTANGLPFHARLREVIIVGTKTVAYPPRQIGKAHRQASKKVDAGEKKPEPVTDPQKARTPLKQLLAGGDSSAAQAVKSLLGF